MIRVENLTFKYKKKNVFTDFNLNIGQGRICGLLGKNGAGKSTLLYLMTGLLQPGYGTIFYNNENVSKRYPSTLRDLFIVPEEFNLPAISLKSYIEVNSPFYPKFSREQLAENLKHFELDVESAINLGALSMGQKKKVYMSFALAANTSLLIMDEPTNGLDIPGKSQFKKFIASNMTDDRTILISTHQVQDVENLLEQVIIIDENQVLLNASVEEISAKLYFVNGAREVEAERALYISPSIMGYNALFSNETGEESTINLETLFNGVLSSPAKINDLFKVG